MSVDTLIHNLLTVTHNTYTNVVKKLQQINPSRVYYDSLLKYVVVQPAGVSVCGSPQILTSTHSAVPSPATEDKVICIIVTFARCHVCCPSFLFPCELWYLFAFMWFTVHFVHFKRSYLQCSITASITNCGTRSHFMLPYVGVGKDLPYEITSHSNNLHGT